jgi:murein DD-endopeptidase MepM/ murein hydrolase activator NlpD
MNASKVGGLLAGLVVALVTAGIAAGGAGLNPPAIPDNVPSDVALTEPVVPTPTTAIAGWSPTVTTSPTAPAATAATATGLMPDPTITPQAPSAPPESPTPAAGSEQVIGQSVQGRPIVAERVGQGPIKVVLVGDIHGEYEANTHLLAEQLLAHFQAHPEEVPEEVSLWVLPTMNPDGLANGTRWNANDVDLNRNADTDLDGCGGNDWSPDTIGHEGPHPGAGGAYPFSEPETKAVGEFLEDAWIAVFYHSAAEAIFVDACQRHAPTARLAEALSADTGYPIPAEGWTGYPVTGDFGDYLAGEGVAAVTVELSDHDDPEFERNREGVRAVLARVDEIVSAESTGVGAEFTWLDERNTGTWRYAENSFIHPLALEVIGTMGYLLDGGRVLALDLTRPAPPRLLLAPGDDVENVRVLEPLDLAASGDRLLVLDRAGDVYGYDPAREAWTVERYDRPSRDSYDHYYVAVTSSEEAHYLLETSHEQVWRFSAGQSGRVWAGLPRSRDVDVSARGQDVYVLTRAMNGPKGTLLGYRDGQLVGGFRPNVDLMHPRQVLATEGAVYVLDRAGRRLLRLDPESGALLAVEQFTDRHAVSALWAAPSGERLALSSTGPGSELVLAGRDTLYFLGEPDRVATIEGGAVLEGSQPHDLSLVGGLRGLSVPIEGATLTGRDFQMPGAPRHYRLGVHEGMDFYGYAVGVTVNRNTPVRAVADGVVVRAMVDHQPLTPAQADAWQQQSRSLGYTPADVLDGYRGMQVWIEHAGGLISRYAHLGSIAPGVVEGAQVRQGEVIATVGNSGTPASLQSKTYDVHLHLELWVGDHYVGQFLRPIEAREWLERILR